MSGRKVYIGRLNDQVRERDVDHFFRGFHVRDIMLKNGYGFVVSFECTSEFDKLTGVNSKANYLRQGGYVFARLCLSVCLSVCQQDNSKSYVRIFLKFSGNVGNGKNYQ